jgi:hypothetical protein
MTTNRLSILTGGKQDEGPIRYIALFLLSHSFLFFSSGCSKSPEDARKELGAMNIQYTEEAFLERVKKMICFRLSCLSSEVCIRRFGRVLF